MLFNSWFSFLAVPNTYTSSLLGVFWGIWRDPVQKSLLSSQHPLHLKGLQMLIGMVVWILVAPSVIIVFTLVILLFLGILRNNLLLLVLRRLSIALVLLQCVNFYRSIISYLILEFCHIGNLFSIVITRVLCISPLIPYFMSAQNTWTYITIFSMRNQLLSLRVCRLLLLQLKL